MNIKSQLVIGNIIALTECIMQEVSGGETMSDEVKRDGCVNSFAEATAVKINNHIVAQGVMYVAK